MADYIAQTKLQVEKQNVSCLLPSLNSYFFGVGTINIKSIADVVHGYGYNRRTTMARIAASRLPFFDMFNLFQFVDQTDGEEAREVDHDYAAARPESSSTDGTDDQGGELGLVRHGLAFLAGCIAFTMHSVDPMLGCSTYPASDELLNSVPSSWISVVSRGVALRSTSYASGGWRWWRNSTTATSPS